MPKTVFAAALAALALISSAARPPSNGPYGNRRVRASTPGKVICRRQPRLSMGRRQHSPTNPSGVMGGVQAGYNAQYGQFIFGGETDLQVTDADDKFAPWKFSNPWFGT